MPAVEELEAIGIGSFTDSTWKQMLDLYSCTECGRCTDNSRPCGGPPPLPKMVTMKLRDHWVGETPGKLTVSGGVITDEEIWGCATCGSCDEQCPVAVEHVDKIIDMRRHLVGMEGRFPAEIEGPFRNGETYGDTQGMGSARRCEWASPLQVELMAEAGDVEVLYWVGCAGSFDDRYREVAAASLPFCSGRG